MDKLIENKLEGHIKSLFLSLIMFALSACGASVK